MRRLKRMLAVLLLCVMAPACGITDDIPETTELRVTAKLLNGRSAPRKKASVEALFDQDDILRAYGWSGNRNWIEVDGGETGTVWVWWQYLNEQEEEYSVWWNDYGSRVKIRKKPYGTVVGYLKTGGEVLVDQVVLGWGHCSRGWVDLGYLTKED